MGASVFCWCLRRALIFLLYQSTYVEKLVSTISKAAACGIKLLSSLAFFPQILDKIVIIQKRDELAFSTCIEIGAEDRDQNVFFLWPFPIFSFFFYPIHHSSRHPISSISLRINITYFEIFCACWRAGWCEQKNNRTKSSRALSSSVEFIQDHLYQGWRF